MITAWSRIAEGYTQWLLLLLAGCASIDFDYPRESSTTIRDTDETYLGKQVVPYVQGKPESESGFTEFVDARGARATLHSKAYIYDTAPESSFWQRSAVGLIRLLPMRGQL